MHTYYAWVLNAHTQAHDLHTWTQMWMLYRNFLWDKIFHPPGKLINSGNKLLKILGSSWNWQGYLASFFPELVLIVGLLRDTFRQVSLLEEAETSRAAWRLSVSASKPSPTLLWITPMKLFGSSKLDLDSILTWTVRGSISGVRRHLFISLLLP